MRTFGCGCAKIVILFSGMCICLGLVHMSLAAEPPFPSKAITLVVGFGAGGASDVAMRALVPTMEKGFKQPVVVLNKPGAATAIAMEYLKSANADGYTIGSFSASGFIGSLMRPVPYDWLNDFTHISQFSTSSVGFAVRQDSPFKTLKDLVDYSSKNPGKLRFGVCSPGCAAHTITSYFVSRHKLQWTYVPFDDDATTATALMGGHVDAMCSSPSGWGPFVNAGQARAVISFTPERPSEYAGVPSAQELNEPYPEFQIYGLAAPKGLPENIVKMYASAVKAATEDPSFIGLMKKRSLRIEYLEGENYRRNLIKIDQEVAQILKGAGVKLVRDPVK